MRLQSDLRMHKARGISVENVLGIVLSVVLVLGLLNARNDGLKLLGFLALAAALGTGIVYLILRATTKWTPKEFVPTVVWALLFVMSYSVGILNDRYGMIAQVAASILFFLGMALMPFSRKMLHMLFMAGSAVILMSAALWVGDGMPIEKFNGIVENSNMFGMSIFIFMFFILAYRHADIKWFKMGILLVAIVLLFVSTNRTIWVSALVSTIIFWMWPRISRGKTGHILTFVILISATIAITVGYIYVIESPIGPELNRLTKQITGKNLFSGRHLIWLSVVNAIEARPIFGYGGGLNVSDIIGMELSAHSFYMQTTLQVGLFGLTIFLGLLAAIWMLLRKNRQEYIVRLTASYLGGIMIMLCSSVFLTQTNMAMSTLTWVVIGIGISAVINKRRDVRIA